METHLSDDPKDCATCRYYRVVHLDADQFQEHCIYSWPSQICLDASSEICEHWIQIR